MTQKRTLSGWLTNRYLLIIRNEENFAEKRTISFNYARLLIIAMLAFLITLAFAIYIVTSVLDQWLDPRQAQLAANRQIISLTMSIDSLEQEVLAKDRYIENIRMILSGEVTAIEETEAAFENERKLSGDVLLSNQVDPIDSQFRAEYEQGDLGLISIASDDSDELRNTFLFPPVTGVVTAEFDPQADHYGTDIVSNENEAIKSVADGVVIFAGWTLNDGNVLAIQHRYNLISVYKHNSEILKNVGSFVLSGEIIAIIGNTGELTSGPHLHFELWHRGNPLNPTDFVSF